MRFHYGAVPEDPDFQPEAEGWRPIREPGPLTLQLLALPAAAILLVISVGLLNLVFSGEFFKVQPLPTTNPLPLWLLLSVLILLIPVHELLHAVVHPGWGLSSNSVIGLWLSRALFYAHYEGPMSRNRFLLVFAMPYVVLSLLPIPIMSFAAVFGWSITTVLVLSFLSIVAAVFACGDLVGFLLILLQVPASAVVRNKGWKTYWKPGK